MGPMWSKEGESGLPKDHWIHGALAKEKARHAKKGAVGKPVAKKASVVAKKEAPAQTAAAVTQDDESEYRS